VLPHLADFAVERIARLQVEQFVSSLNKLAGSTKKGVVATLSAVLAAGVEWRLLDYNPTLGIKLGIPHPNSSDCS